MMENQEEELQKIDLIVLVGNFIKTVKKFWIPMLVGVIALTAVYYIYVSTNYAPLYQSQATFTVNSSDSSLVNSGSSGTEQIKESLPYILQSDYMKNLVMDELGLRSFPATIEMESKELADFFVVKVTANDAEMSAQIINSIIANCPKASVYVLGKISVEVLDSSASTGTPINYLDKKMSLVKGAAFGCMLCAGIVFVYTFTNHTIQKEEDLRKYLSVSCLATLPQISFKKRRKEFDRHIYIYNDKVGHAFLENVRTMRTRVQRAMAQLNAKTVLVTSSIPEEGKSTVAANLALSLAEKGSKVVLVDLDLRNPSVGDVLGIDAKPQCGVADILKGETTSEKKISIMRKWNLSLLFAGEPQNNPLELLNKENLAKLVAILRKNYDYIVLDTPPAAMLSDAAAIGKYADCAVYVVKQDYARIERVTEGLEALGFAQVPVLGVVLNGMEKSLSGYGSYRYGNYGAYGYYREASSDTSEYIDLENPWENES